MPSFFPLDVLDEIWDVVESVSEGFLTYSYTVQNNFTFQNSEYLIRLLSIMCLYDSASSHQSKSTVVATGQTMMLDYCYRNNC